MFGFLSKGKQKPDQQQAKLSGSDQSSTTQQMQFSSQAAAALAAAASAKVSGKAAGPKPIGRRLQGVDTTLNMDALRSGETVPELQVQPITLLKFDYKLEHTQQVAISSSYICYGLKAGHIRALNRNTASRALFKGHPTSLSHMAFFNPDTNLLASASRQGDITVRLVTDGQGPDGDIAPAETIMMAAQLQLPAAAAAAAAGSPLVKLAWHPTIPQILAAGAAGAVNIFEVPTAPPAEQPPAPVAPGIQYVLPGDGTAAVTAVAFSPSGDLLLAADSAGNVHAWWLEGEDETDAPLLTWQPFSGSTTGSTSVASVHFLHQAGDGSSLLLTGDANNATLKLWALPPAALVAGDAPACLQTISFTSDKGQEDIFCHVVVQLELQLVVLANTVRKQVYTLHYTLSSSSAGPAAAVFDYAAFFGVKHPILSLTTGLEAVESQVVPGEVQPQQLLLYTVQTDAIQQYVVNPALCSVDASEAAAGEEEVEEGEEVSSSAASAPATLAPAAGEDAAATEAAAAAAASGSAAPEQAVVEAPVAAVVPPPAQLPTPGRLLHAKAADQEAAAETATGDVTADRPAAEPAASSDAAASREAAELAAVAAADEVPAGNAVQENAAAAEEDLSISAAAPAAAAPLPPMPTTSLLHSAEKAPAAVAAAAAAAEPAANEAPAEEPVAAEPAASEPAVESVAAPAVVEVAAPAARAVAPAEIAALQQQMQQLLAMQQDLAAQLQTSSHQTVSGVKSELCRALKATEASLTKQVEGSIKAANKRAEEERRKGSAKERAELEKVIAAQLGQVSTALQRDLLKALADAAREQSRSTVTAVVNSVSTVVAQGVASTLQRELAGGAGGSQLQAALERSLASSLAHPLHEALRENFASSIIPAFERATQVMFGQVEAAFTTWLAESSRTVAAAQSDAAASLNSSLQQLQSVVTTMRGELADTSRSLSRIASSTASRAAEAGSGGGARPAEGAAAAAAPTADPRIEIGTLLSVRKYEDALVKALNTASLDVLLWACKQVDPALVLGGSSVSQTTLLSLVHQLSVDLKNDANTPVKLNWLTEAAPVIDPHNPVTAPHLKVVLTGVMTSLKQLVNSLPSNDVMAKQGKVALHLFNSLLHQ